MSHVHAPVPTQSPPACPPAPLRLGRGLERFQPNTPEGNEVANEMNRPLCAQKLLMYGKWCVWKYIKVKFKKKHIPWAGHKN